MSGAFSYLFGGSNLSCFTAGLTIISLFTPPFVSSVDEVSGAQRDFQPLSGTTSTIFSEVIRQPSFWRLTGLVTLLIGVKQIHRLLDAALPKYLMRALGCDASFGTVFAINPFMLIALVPFTTALTARWHPLSSIQVGSWWIKCLQSLLAFDVYVFLLRFRSQIGAVLVSIAPFLFLAPASFGVAACFVALVSVGEAFVTPRVNEYSASIAPEVSRWTLSSYFMFCVWIELV